MPATSACSPIASCWSRPPGTSDGYLDHRKVGHRPADWGMISFPILPRAKDGSPRENDANRWQLVLEAPDPVLLMQ